MSDEVKLAIALEALQAIAERRVLVMDDEGETVADAFVKVASRALEEISPDS